MALVSDLVSVIAEVEGIPEATVNLIARFAREAGYLSTGARGRNAPRANLRDCANLLIAVNGSGCVIKDAPKALASFRDLICHAPHGSSSVPRPGAGVVYGAIEHDELRFLDRHGSTTFGEMLESIIDRFIGGELQSFMLDQAREYISPRFYEIAEKELGNDERALADREVAACVSLLALETVAFTIEFHRPNAHAKIIIDRSIGGSRELIAEASFIANEGVAGSDGDRRERTTIGYRTLIKLADVMRSL